MTPVMETVSFTTCTSQGVEVATTYGLSSKGVSSSHGKEHSTVWSVVPMPQRDDQLSNTKTMPLA